MGRIIFFGRPAAHVRVCCVASPSFAPQRTHVAPVGLSAQMRLGGCRGFARAAATLARARPCVGLPSVASAGRKTIGTDPRRITAPIPGAIIKVRAINRASTIVHPAMVEASRFMINVLL